MTWQGENFIGGMKAWLSKEVGVSSKLVALNSDVIAKTEGVCGECPVANRKVDGVVCHRISSMNGIAFFSLDGASMDQFLQGAACKINQVQGVDLALPNRISPSESQQIFG